MYDHEEKFQIIFIIGVILLLGVILFLGLKEIKEMKYQEEITDLEIWNGRVTDKRMQDRQESYTCNCRPETYTTTDMDGDLVTRTRTKCDTCWRTVYDFWVDLSFGDKVYYAKGQRNKNEPEDWKKVQIGEAASAEKEYKNYKQASQSTIFKEEYKSYYDFYQKYIPEQPKIHNRIKINRVFHVNPEEYYHSYNKEEIDKLNHTVSEINADLNSKSYVNPIKEINVMFFILPEELKNTASDDYLYALLHKWEGINKNEFIIFLVLDKDNQVVRVKGLSWSVETENIVAKLDGKAYKEYKDMSKFDNMLSFLEDSQEILKDRFVREEMENFEYLDRENREEKGLKIKE